MKFIIARVRIVFRGERVLYMIRQLMLHTSAAGFGMDFAHAIIGKAMILAAFWEKWRELGVDYSAFAAVVIVYIDGHLEKVRHKASAAPTAHHDEAGNEADADNREAAEYA